MLKWSILTSFLTLLIKTYSIEFQFEHLRRRLEHCPDPDANAYPTPTPNGPNCTRFIFDEDFETSYEGWTGNLGANEKLSSDGYTSQYFKIANRRQDWQGPLFEIDHEQRKCIKGGATYFFSAYIRLTKGSGISNCKAKGVNCPIVKWYHMNNDEKITSYPLTAFNFADAVDDGTWYHWIEEFVFPPNLVEDTHIFSSISINGPEPGVDISIDDIKLFLPPAEHYPRPGSVCNDLIINGDASASPIYKYPISTFDPRETLKILEDADGRYYSMDFRKNIWSGPKYELIPGCLRDNAIFKFTSKIWIHDSVPRKSRVIIRYNEDGRYKFDTVTICPDSSTSIGWVECNGEIKFYASKYHTPPFVMSWMTHDTTAHTDWRDISLTVASCGSITIGDACQRRLRVNVDAQVDPNITIDVTNGTISASVSSTFISIDPIMDTHWYTARRFYSLSVGSGNWSASFSSSGNEVWPYFAEVLYENTPNCTDPTDTFLINPPDVTSDTCNNLIRNTDFEIGEWNTSQWYHSGGSMKLVDGFTGRGLSTDGRTNMAQGLVHFVDTRCMTAGARYDIMAKVKLVDPLGGTPTCNPDFGGVGGPRCPRANIRTSFGGTPTAYNYALGNTLGPFKPGEWNMLFGSFSVDETMDVADQVAFYIDGVIEGIDIVIDDVIITPSSTQEDPGCLRNGDLEVGDTRNWECVGTFNCALKIVQPGHNASTYALSTINRQATWWGMKQDMDKNCFIENTTYEVSARMKLKDENGRGVSCDPFLYYQGLPDFCPNGVLQHPTDNSQRIRVASTIGPRSSDGWDHIYGTFTMSNAMLSWPKLELFFGWASADIDIVIDDVIIKPYTTNYNCLQLVKNGDAEVGDARDWYIKGSSNYGTIAMVEGAYGSNYAFHHTGFRSGLTQGLYQELDKSCMPLDSVWKITCTFKFFDKDGNPVDCYNEKSAQCVKWRVEANNVGGKKVFGKNLDNEKVGKGEWVLGEWNDYEATFTIDKQFDDREQIFISAFAPIGFSYMVDNIRVMPAAASEKGPIKPGNGHTDESTFKPTKAPTHESTSKPTKTPKNKDKV